MDEPEKIELSPLREDLVLKPGPSTEDGLPTWSVYDSSRHLYFRIGWVEFEILCRWQLADVDKIVESVNQQTTLSISGEAVERVQTFIRTNNLCQVSDQAGVQELLQRNKQMKHKPLMKQISGFLFYRIRLIRPEPFLEKTLPYVKPFFTKTFLYLLIAMSILSLYLISREWEQFKNTLLHFFNWQGMAYFFTALFVAKVIHEFGHAYTSKYLGCRVASMGVVFLVFWPVFYTDTTDAWKLTSRKQKLAIGAAGMIAELTIAVIASLVWVIMPDGIVRSIAFFLATVSWVITLGINLNPFLRFDGYYLFADLLGVSNLQQKSFALAKWRMRETLCQFDEPIPYRFKQKIQRLLIIYAYCTWVYRFFLFVGIALLVYFMFFKIAGILLLILELAVLVAWPIYNELKEYWKRKDKIKWNKGTITLSSVLFGLFLVIAIPWRASIEAPAVLEYKSYTKLFVPYASQVSKVSVKAGQKVTKGQVLMQLSSLELDYKIKQTQKDVDIIRMRIRRDLHLSRVSGYKQADRQELVSKENEYKNLLEEKERLVIKAPFTGYISSIRDNLIAGQWLAEDDYVMELINQQKTIAEAYVAEQEITRLQIGSVATFYPANPDSPVLKMKITEIDRVTSEKLNSPYHASVYGGDIAVNKDPQGQLLIDGAVYRITFQPQLNKIDVPFVQKGYVLITGTRQSLLGRWWQQIAAVLIRESGF